RAFAGVDPSPQLEKMREISVPSSASSSLTNSNTRTATTRATLATNHRATKAPMAPATVGARVAISATARSAGSAAKRVSHCPGAPLPAAHSLTVAVVIRVTPFRATRQPVDGRRAEHAREFDDGGQRCYPRHHSLGQPRWRLLVEGDQQQGAYVDSRGHRRSRTSTLDGCRAGDYAQPQARRREREKTAISARPWRRPPSARAARVNAGGEQPARMARVA